MVAPFATSANIAAAWRSLSEDEEVQADYRLAQASRIIRHEFSTVDTRITAGDIEAELVADVAISMVLRYLRNPDGKRQETLEDYSFTRDATGSSGELFLTDKERALLTPVASTSRAFSIDTSPPARCEVYLPSPYRRRTL